MAKDTSAVASADLEKPAPAAGVPDFIIRLAEDLKNKSGSDLPLSCFVEQVRMRLAGKSPVDIDDAADEHSAGRSSAHNYRSSDCFKAWAMPE